MNQSRYKPLDPEQEEIRLIEIRSPGTETTPTECRLSTISLLGNTRFTALSYVWGDPAITKDITLDGSVVPITTNLADALGCVKHHWQQQYPERDPNSFRLWVDAICINQKDLKERNQQVQNMGSIYSQAELVLSWLGHGDEEMSLALQSFETIALEVQSLHDDDFSFEWMEKHPSLCVQDTDRDGDGLGNKAWTAMWSFFDAPYWRRVWIFQELALGRNALLISGSESLRFESLATVCAWSRRVQGAALHQLHKPPSVSYAAWIAATGPYLDWYTINKISLAKKKRHHPARRWNFLLLCRDLGATDPRDHIYGLLEVLEADMQPKKIIPQYEKTVGQVYSDALTHWIEEEQDLNFLFVAGIGQFEYEPGLPSWTPNLKEASKRAYKFCITAGNAELGVFKYHTTERTAVLGLELHVAGLTIDRITRIEEAPNLDTWNDGTMLNYCVDFMARNPVYITGIPPLQAIFHVLMMRHDDEQYRYEAEERDDCDEEENEEIWEDIDSKADDEEIFSSEDKEFYLLALGFLRYLIFTPEHIITPQDRFLPLGLSSDGPSFPASFQQLLYPSCQFLEENLPNLATDYRYSEGPLADASRNVLRKIVQYRDTFRFVETAGGYLGLAPDGVKVGDRVCVLKGCDTPILLRKMGEGDNVQDEEGYVHVGTCFVLGLMSGEARGMFERGQVKVQRFKIR